MKILQCNPGNKPCGGRCIPNSHTCGGNGEISTATALAVVGVSAAAIAAVIGIRKLVKNRKKKKLLDKFKKDLSASNFLWWGGGNKERENPNRPDFSTYISIDEFTNMGRDGNEMRDYPMFRALRNAQNDEEFTSKVQVTTGGDILKDERLRPEVRSLLEKRGTDLSSIMIVEVNPLSLSKKLQNKLVDFIGDPRATRGMAATNDNKATVIYINQGPQLPGADESDEDALNHELVHAIQKTSGWVMNNDRYLELLKSPQKAKEFGKGRVSLTHVEQAYKHQLDSAEYSVKMMQKQGVIKNRDPHIAIATKDLIRRMEFEAWWTTNFKNYDDIA